MTRIALNSYHPRLKRLEIASRMTASLRPLALIIAVALLSGCAAVRNFEFRNLGIPPVHRVTIQQGNVITQEMIDRLRPGMTRRQVQFVMGEPILGNTFQADRWEYIYNIQVGAQPRRQQRLTLYFEGDALTRFEGDFVPSELQVVRDAALQEAVDAVRE